VTTERNTDISEERIRRCLATARYIAVVFSCVLTTLHKNQFTYRPDDTKYHLGFFVQKIRIYGSSIAYSFIYCCILAVIRVLWNVFCLLRQRKKTWAVLLFIACQYELYCHYLHDSGMVIVLCRYRQHTAVFRTLTLLMVCLLLRSAS
jgi:hypothetical protein